MPIPLESPEDALSRVARKQATRRALRDAALRCFESQGYAATSIADVTRRAGVAKGTFYVHFESKEALLDEELAEFNAAFAVELTAAVASSRGRPLEATVRAVVDAFLAHWTARRAFVRVYAERTSLGLSVDALPFGLSPDMRLVLEPMLATYFPAMPPQAVPLVVQGLLATYMRLGLQAVFREDLDPRDVADVLVAMTTGALSSYPRRPQVNP